jgi:nicotinamide mononucleotide transporter
VLKGWTKFEKVWLILFLLLVVGATITFSISGTNYEDLNSILLNWVISPLSAITGIVCVVLVAKGKISNYAWGAINSISYGYVAYMSGYYGDMVLNLFYFLPFQLIGFLWWRKHLRPSSKEDVVMRKMGGKQIAVVTIVGIAATALFGWALSNLDHWFVNVMKRNVSIYAYIDDVFHVPFLGALGDASTETLQIVAQILMTLAFAEQWILWFLVNVITIVMWVAVLVADPTTAAWVLPTIIMWVAYLVNSVYGYINWLKGAKSV